MHEMAPEHDLSECLCPHSTSGTIFISRPLLEVVQLREHRLVTEIKQNIWTRCKIARTELTSTFDLRGCTE
jgi:hypothetical protein